MSHGCSYLSITLYLEKATTFYSISSDCGWDDCGDKDDNVKNPLCRGWEGGDVITGDVSDCDYTIGVDISITLISLMVVP